MLETPCPVTTATGLPICADCVVPGSARLNGAIGVWPLIRDGASNLRAALA